MAGARGGILRRIGGGRCTVLSILESSFTELVD